MQPAIETHSLSRRYGSRLVVDSLDLVVPAGRVAGFVGPNGAGKTTTIRMLLGLIRPSSGAALILGRSVASDPAVLDRVGAMVEGPAVYPGLSGRDNLRVLSLLGGLASSKVDRALDLVALSDRACDPVNTYSLGMRQRLGIAAALLPEPAVVILDEPTNGLDPAGILDMRGLLRELAQAGTTVFVSSHQLSELEQICDHLVLLRRGRLVYQGPMAELLDRRLSRLVGRPESPEAARGLADLVRASGHEAHVEDGAVIVAAPGAWAGAFNRLAHANGMTLVELGVHAPTLEEAFLALTGEPAAGESLR